MASQLKQLTDHIWLYPHHSNFRVVQSSVGVITTRNASVLVDAGNNPRLARKIKTELIRNGLPPVTGIIYTHHHWDHTYGACEFNVQVTAHTKCKAILLEEAKKPWGPEYLSQEIKLNPKLYVGYTAKERAIRNWDAFHIVVPDEVFEKDKTIMIDNITIKLTHVGGEHAEDSIVVKVPQEGVMFLGDCYYVPPLHLRKSGSRPSVDMLKKLNDDAYHLYIEGHDYPFSREELLEFLNEDN
ncbi:MAG: MBL fold metallo-hydrolase [Anaerolineales bacterium]|jgi:glyoxylase-like metal-dependent hydrolase (beta-lactamase superfamily II)